MIINATNFVFWTVWPASVCYALYAFFAISNGDQKVLDSYDFANGWWFLDRKQDISDFEWFVMKYLFTKLWFLLLIHVILSQAIQTTNRMALLTFHAFYPLVCIAVILGPAIAILFSLYTIILYFLHTTGRKIFCYAISLGFMFVLPWHFANRVRAMIVSEQNEGYLVDISFVWLISKCLSFSVDRITSKKHLDTSVESILLIFSYCFYLPTVFSGPLINYDAFADQIFNAQKKPFKSQSLLSLVHPILGILILEFLLHFLYASSVKFYPSIVQNYGAWETSGLFYALSTHFYLKYLVIYGLPHAVSKLGNIDVPPPPLCVSRSTSPTYLWRTFDRGLYLWILKYLYLPIVEGYWTAFRKLVGVSASFAFVCVWHGMDRSVCTWIALNYIAIVVEKLVFKCINSRWYKNFQLHLSNQGKQIVLAALAAPFFQMICIATCYFLANWEIGDILVKKIFLTGWTQMLSSFFILLCACGASSQVKEWEDGSKKLSLE